MFPHGECECGRPLNCQDSVNFYGLVIQLRRGHLNLRQSTVALDPGGYCPSCAIRFGPDSLGGLQTHLPRLLCMDCMRATRAGAWNRAWVPITITFTNAGWEVFPISAILRDFAGVYGISVRTVQLRSVLMPFAPIAPTTRTPTLIRIQADRGVDPAPPFVLPPGALACACNTCERAGR